MSGAYIKVNGDNQMYCVFGKYFKSLSEALEYAKVKANKSGQRIMIVKTGNK